MPTISLVDPSVYINNLNKPTDGEKLRTDLNNIIAEVNLKETRIANIESNTFTFSGLKTFNNGIATNTISEQTASTGVTVDGLKILDGTIQLVPTSGFAPTADGQIGINSTNNALLIQVAGVDRTIATVQNLASDPVVGPPPTYASASTVTIPAGTICKDDTDKSTVVVLGTSLTVSLASTGLLGRDSGSESSNTWYYIWVIWKASDLTTSAVFSTSNTSPNLSDPAFTGYDKKRMLPIAIRNDASSNIIPFYVAGAWAAQPTIMYNTENTLSAAPTRIVNGGTASSFTDATSPSSFIPPISTVGIFMAGTFDNATSGALRTKGASHTGETIVTNGLGQITIETDSSQVIQYIRSTGSNGVYVSVKGFVVNKYTSAMI